MNVAARSEISDVVSSYVHLTGRGTISGACVPSTMKRPRPFQSRRRSRSITASAAARGSVISFIMEMENLPFVEAAPLPAERAGMEMPETGENEGYRRRKEAASARTR